MGAVSGADHDSPVYLWVNPKFADAGVESDPEALALLASAHEVRCFNAPFEQAVCHATGFDPYISMDKWRCTQAMARIAGLPESLDRCGDALEIDARKDKEGKDLIKFFSMPQEDGRFNEPRDHREKWAQFCDYCKQDVRAEKEIHRILRVKFDLKGENLETFLFTLRMNDMGIPVNVPALQNAKKILDVVWAEAGGEFTELTGLKVTQRAKVLAWLQAHGLAIEDMQAQTLQAVDLTAKTPELVQAVTLYCQLSYAATKKLETMLDWACPDGRMRGVLKFYGAGTGRWSAGGPQIQNAKKPTPAMRPITKQAYDYVSRGGTVEGLSAIYGEPIEVLASCIRHFVHEPGSEMLDGDYNAIEARILCWSAKELGMLKAWRDGTDLYKRMASVIFNVTTGLITSDQRDMGKRTILGCGYSMGAEKFLSTCQQYGVPCSVALAEKCVNAYRALHPAITKYWRVLDSDAKQATSYRGNVFGGFVVEAAAKREYLFFTLPSGRRLAYPDPQLEEDSRFGMQLTYWGQIPGSVNYGRIKLYGGKIAENITQAIAADVMSYGARQTERQWMLPFALIHDQALAVRLGNQTAEDFAASLASLPPWAEGLPLKVEAKITPYYTK